MSSIYVDADACPLKEEIIAVLRRFNLNLIFVANSPLKKLQGREGIEVLQSGDEFDAVDTLILDKAGIGDCVITKDLLFAKKLIAKKCAVFSFQGNPLNEENIGHALSLRELHQEIREHGRNEAGKGKRKNSREEQSRFKSALHDYLVRRYPQLQK